MLHSSKKVTDKLKISVVIPAKNASLFIGDAINSVIKQTHPVYEILVVNNSSTDDTLQTIEQFAKEFHNLIILNCETGGVSSARNLGILKASGDYIAFLDADDTWEPHKIETHVNHLSKHPGCVFSFSGARNVTMPSGKELNSYKTNPEYTFLKLLQNDFVISGSASSVVIEKETLISKGLYDENLSFGEDWDLWLKIGESNYICELRSILVTIRNFKESAQGKRYGTLQDYHRTFSVISQWNRYSNYWLRDDLETRFVRLLASDLIRNWRNALLTRDWTTKVLGTLSSTSLFKLNIALKRPFLLPIIILFRWSKLLLHEKISMKPIP